MSRSPLHTTTEAYDNFIANYRVKLPLIQQTLRVKPHIIPTIADLDDVLDDLFDDIMKKVKKTSTPEPVNTNLIVGVVVGASVFIMVIIAVVVLVKRNKARRL